MASTGLCMACWSSKYTYKKDGNSSGKEVYRPSHQQTDYEYNKPPGDDKFNSDIMTKEGAETKTGDLKN